MRIRRQAIDLIDEAASRLRLQQESKPEAIENLDRAIITLKIEQEALSKVWPREFCDGGLHWPDGLMDHFRPTCAWSVQESDPASRERLETLRTELEAKEAEARRLTAIWEEERCVPFTGATCAALYAHRDLTILCTLPLLARERTVRRCASRSASRSSWSSGAWSWKRPNAQATGYEEPTLKWALANSGCAHLHEF